VRPTQSEIRNPKFLMRPFRSTAGVLLLLFLLPWSLLPASESDYDRFAQLDAAASAARRQVAGAEAGLRLLGETLPDGASPVLDAARATLADAERRKAEFVAANPELSAAASKLAEVRQKRDGAVEALLAGSPAYRSASARAEELRRSLTRTAAEAVDPKAVGNLQVELDALEGSLHAARRACWSRAEIEAAYRDADRTYAAFQKAADRNPAVAAAEKEVGAARKARIDAERVVALEQPRGRELDGERERLALIADERAAALRAFLDPLIGPGAVQAQVRLTAAPSASGKASKAPEAGIWIPPNCKRVRGLVLGHPPALGVGILDDPAIRLAAAVSGLAIVRPDNVDALFDYTGAGPARLEELLGALAKSTGHPEIPNAAYLTVGHSTSGIYARNVAYWRPGRTVAVVHIKSGNLHQHRPDPALSLAGVPFLAINGEFEEFGPEGGIRKEYGAQTQWVMIREQLLRWRRSDPEHLVALAVHPGGGHGNWNPELSRLVGRFIVGSARKRLPEAWDGSEPVRCRTVRASEGWLSDARLDAPTHPAAAFAEYAGPRAEAFWHPDEATARALLELHAGRFLLADPTVASPVPESWPTGK
jgi:hypothetical protein